MKKTTTTNIEAIIAELAKNAAVEEGKRFKARASREELKEWAEKYEQVSVTIGDAFQKDYNPYTILFLGRPFLPKTFQQFIEQLEKSLTHPITLIYWVDQQSGYMLKDRSGWEKQFREKLYVMYGLIIAGTPQGYSIWTYDPALRAEAVDGNA